MGATLKGLPTAVQTKVFRTIDEILRRDPVLSSAVRKDSFRSWRGDNTDTLDFTVSQAPAIRITPTSGPEQFAFPGAMKGPLYIKVEMLVAGTCVDDPQNLWQAIVQALYPPSNPSQFIQTLQTAGAYDGVPLFTQPAFDDSPSDRFFACVGMIKIDLRLSLGAG